MSLSMEVPRRTLVRGAAWSVPVIAASVAVPTAAASKGEPVVCTPCITAGFPIVGGLVAGAWTSQAVVAGNRGVIAMPNVFGLDATGCGISFGNIIEPAFTFIVTKATLTMTDGESYDSSVGLGAGVGEISTVGLFPGAFVFTGVHLPSKSVIVGTSYTRPERLTVFVNATFQYGIGLSIQCPMELVWDLHALATGGVIFGAGTVNFSGTATA